jgi:hypothetical protein
VGEKRKEALQFRLVSISELARAVFGFFEGQREKRQRSDDEWIASGLGQAKRERSDSNRENTKKRNDDDKKKSERYSMREG